jgi:hypothetical protein
MFCRRCRTVTRKVAEDGTVEYSYKYGRVCVDRLYPTDQRVELYCMQCGKRWFIKNNPLNGFSKWLLATEYQHRLNYATSS